MRGRVARLLGVAVALGIVVALAACGGGASSSAPTLSDPSATGREQATRFLALLQSKDTAGLDAFLDPAFQLQRADGTGATKPEYLAKPAQVASFELGPSVSAVQNGPLLTVRWELTVVESIGGQPQREGLAPRLSTFVWSDGDWKLLSHANFNLPAG